MSCSTVGIVWIFVVLFLVPVIVGALQSKRDK